MIPNVLTLQILLHSYCTPSPFDPERSHAPAAIEAKSWLLNHKLIEPAEIDDVYNTTDRGNALISYFLTTPLPLRHWIVPERNQAHGQ